MRTLDSTITGLRYVNLPHEQGAQWRSVQAPYMSDAYFEVRIQTQILCKREGKGGERAVDVRHK